VTIKTPGWICDQGDGTFDHNWKYRSDWYGDPEVINGTQTIYFRTCVQCGVEESC